MGRLSANVVIFKYSYPTTHVESSALWFTMSDEGTILEDSVPLVLFDFAFLWSLSTIFTFDFLSPGNNPCILKDIVANLSHRDPAH